MIEKYRHATDADAAARLPFSYFSSRPYLEFSAYVINRNDERIFVWQDVEYPHDFPAMFLPRDPRNWEKAAATLVTTEQVQAIRDAGIPIKKELKIETEYFYKTAHLLSASGPLTKRAAQFAKGHAFELSRAQPVEAIRNFYDAWKGQKDRNAKALEEGDAFFYFCLEHLDTLEIQQVYVTVGGALVGFAWGVLHQPGRWVGLHLHVNYDFPGLSRFLHLERAKLFSETDECTLGTGCRSPGIIQFKQELGPCRTEPYTFIVTDGQ